MYALDHPATSTRTTLAYSVLKTLAWFDLFHYPLTAGEILHFSHRTATIEELQPLLQQLLREQVVFYVDGFYALHNESALAARRRSGNEKATIMLRKAHRIARLLQGFPFVRGVCISGSLSKNFAGDNADIDLFIITSANRLWLARTAMHALKKLSYCWGGQHDFCMNYYIDEEALLIREQNMFTAIELLTLMPVCGDDSVQRFFAVNGWVQDYLPAYHGKSPVYPCSGKGSWLKRSIEWFLNLSAGEAADNYLMQLTSRRWKKKESDQRQNIQGGRMGLITGKHFAKPNPQYFQRRILDEYQQKLQKLWAMVDRADVPVLK